MEKDRRYRKTSVNNGGDYTLNHILLGYFIGINVVSAISTIYDKRQAIRQGRRVRERTLILMGIFGGAVAMWVTMKIIRHKTKHKKFMIGLPVIIIFQAAVAIGISYWALGGF